MAVTRFVWALGLSMVIGLVGCGSESDGGAGSLIALGIDDGASGGASTSAQVTKDKGGEMTLATGAGVKVPKDAVDADIELGLKRPPDSEALVLVKRLDSKQSAVSAPYVVTPHGTKFKTEVEVTLPIAKSHDRTKLKVRWLEDEKDTRWKDLGSPQVEGDRATVKVDHFSVLVLVEDSSDGPADVPADAGAGRDPETDAGASGSDDDAGDVAVNDAGREPIADASAGGGSSDGGLPISRPGDTVLSTLPFDLLADCPASGCTLAIGAMPDGVWADCQNLADGGNFDPETFDFAAACADAEPNPADITFVYGGATKNWEAELGACAAWTESLSPDGTTLYESECGAGYGAIDFESDIRSTADGTLFTYDVDDCGGTCSATVFLQVFRPGDTSALNESCAAAAEQYDQTCAAAGAVIPFGPSGVGALAPALLDTAWLRCDSGVDPVEACSAMIADPFVNGYLSVFRFTDVDQDGNAEAADLSYESEIGWEATCGLPAGADATRLRIFWCADPSDPDGWGAMESTWELRRVGAQDYLLITEPADDEVDIYVSAPQGLIPSPDPCLDVQEVTTCVIR